MVQPQKPTTFQHSGSFDNRTIPVWAAGGMQMLCCESAGCILCFQCTNRQYFFAV